ncbi:MAG: hypothetical protein M3P41_12375 [Actinomycetota bacterium]|nr:hypothetical protein [Actinomycetota bacterium]
MENDPEVVADADVVDFISDHGGEVFVWADGAGLKHVRVERPDNDVNFLSIPAEGFRLLVDSEIDPPTEWKIVLRHFPHGHVDALYDGVSPGDPPEPV